MRLTCVSTFSKKTFLQRSLTTLSATVVASPSFNLQEAVVLGLPCLENYCATQIIFDVNVNFKEFSAMKEIKCALVWAILSLTFIVVPKDLLWEQQDLALFMLGVQNYTLKFLVLTKKKTLEDFTSWNIRKGFDCSIPELLCCSLVRFTKIRVSCSSASNTLAKSITSNNVPNSLDNMNSCYELYKVTNQFSENIFFLITSEIIEKLEYFLKC